MLNIIIGSFVCVFVLLILVYLCTKKLDMIQEPITKRMKTAMMVLSVVVMVVGYSTLSWNKHQENPDDKTIPSWTQLLDGFVLTITPEEKETNLLASVMGIPESAEKEMGERMLFRDLRITGIRIALGYSISVLIGVCLGIVMGAVPLLEAFFSVPLRFASRIVPTAALAVFFALVGTDLEMYVSMILFGLIPVIAINTCLEIKSCPKELKYKAYTIGASHFEVIWNVFTKVKLPQIIEVIKNNIGMAIVYLLAAEVLVAGEGFGYTIRIFARKLDMSVVYPYLAIIAIAGFVFEFGLDKIQHFLCPWYRAKKGGAK